MKYNLVITIAFKHSSKLSKKHKQFIAEIVEYRIVNSDWYSLSKMPQGIKAKVERAKK